MYEASDSGGSTGGDEGDGEENDGEENEIDDDEEVHSGSEEEDGDNEYY